MRVDVYDESGTPIPAGAQVKGELVCTAPFPSMPVGFGTTLATPNTAPRTSAFRRLVP
jgi:acyl-coenzyme A synthetase/AMP-(fatty) acid ligase